jgi:hypothetical protein
MKSILYATLFAFTFASQLSIKAQTTPESFLSQLPAIPTVVCAADTSVVNHFTNRIYRVKADLQQVIDRIHADAQASMEKSKNKIVSNQIKQSGLNKSDVRKLQQSDGSEDEGEKAVEKVVSEQYGVSIQDLEKVGEMNEAEQEKWAQNYAGQQMQKAKQNPQAAIKKGEKSARLFDLTNEQKAIGERITEKMSKVDKLLKYIEQQDTIETDKLNEKIRPLEKQLCSGICSDAEIARSNAAEKQIYALHIRFCEKMSPMLIEAISQYLTTVKTLFPDYRRLTEIQNETTNLQQIGELVPQDLYCIKAVDKYADVLLSAYNYCVGKFEPGIHSYLKYYK